MDTPARLDMYKPGDTFKLVVPASGRTPDENEIWKYEGIEPSECRPRDRIIRMSSNRHPASWTWTFYESRLGKELVQVKKKQTVIIL